LDPRQENSIIRYPGVVYFMQVKVFVNMIYFPCDFADNTIKLEKLGAS